MERIKLAIEKAKAGGGGSTRLHGSGHGNSVFHGTARGGADFRTGVPGPLESAVEYTKTAVVYLDETHLERHRVVAHLKSHAASWVFDVLRTQVLQKMDENGWRTLAVTSPSVESGKTVVSINLAISIAQQTNRTALLVDFDLRRPSVARTLGLGRSESLNDVLDGNIELADALVNPGIDRLVVLPTRRPVSGASEVLSSAKVGALISDLRERYDDRIVIFDLPPVLAADDVMSLVPRVDCVLMVVGSGVSTQKEVEEAMSRLSKANLLGVVLNKDDSPSQNAYY